MIPPELPPELKPMACLSCQSLSVFVQGIVEAHAEEGPELVGQFEQGFSIEAVHMGGGNPVVVKN